MYNISNDRVSGLRKTITSLIPSMVRAYVNIAWYEVYLFSHPKYRLKRDNSFRLQLDSGLGSIPLLIISYNHLSYLKACIEGFERIGITNIVIVDNHSSYPPLLKYYDNCGHRVVHLEHNYNHKVIWEAEELAKYRKGFYMVTDPDIVLVDECPSDIVYRLFRLLWKYPCVRKVGVSLKIDDIPQESIFYNEIQEVEGIYYSTLIKKDNIYFAGVDTTFALYLPDELVTKQRFYRSFRTAYPYQARHLPWYKKIEDVDDEDIFYTENKTNGWWNVVSHKVTKD